MGCINYSIIIPSHNCPGLLQRCLDSIPQRDDVQTIIVDDNSNPELVDFSSYPGLERPATEVVFDKTGKGAGHARNLGVQKAVGRWLVFADSDDEFITPALSAAMDKYVDSDSDIIFLNAKRVDESTGTLVRNQLDEARMARNPSRYEKSLRYASFAPWGKFISRSMVADNGLQFSEVPYGNDLYFSTLTGYHAGKVETDLSCIYIWYMRKSGNISSATGLASAQTKLDEECRRNSFLASKGLARYGTNLYVQAYDNFVAAGESGCAAIRRISACIPLLHRPGKFLYFIAYRFKKKLGL